MPKVYEYLGLVFFFYSNDHEPVHLHARYQDTESKFEVIEAYGKTSVYGKEVKGKKPLSRKHMQMASALVQLKRTDIIRIWEDFFVHGRKIKCERITEKII